MLREVRIVERVGTCYTSASACGTRLGNNEECEYEDACVYVRVMALLHRSNIIFFIIPMLFGSSVTYLLHFTEESLLMYLIYIYIIYML